MTTVEKKSGLKQRIAEAAAFIGWIYNEFQKFEQSHREWDQALEDVKAESTNTEWFRNGELTKMVPCVHCKREIAEFASWCRHCKQFQEELEARNVTQPFYHITFNHEQHFFSLETGKPLIDGKRPFEAYLEVMRKKDDEGWLL